ncbi:selenocysteine synthase [Arthrobacter crystallopoietes BAB-32]|uniref:L-seryl-tRNA(Sec) selenium transferase n=1 Tax=Arthrobacter crystallopoietes BAB-32 TaxID=1246476 RepID=N1VAZ9_9MICC|nr:L-seryl-tRNA(Sec) selenium transferase [Arthrobacter crystallopoietes]EMY35493.1 selenocysteine synthase [Arthrobacter crystallopoietes BAB-32]
MGKDDTRRLIPRTDRLLAHPELQGLRGRLGETVIRSIIQEIQDQARSGELAPEDVEPEILAAVASREATSLRPVLNATGVIVHTNLGRAPLSKSAREALLTAAGYVDVEMDLPSGMRSRRGAGVRQALLRACPSAEDALAVNNGAAALLLATSVLAGTREVVISRGELVEIGAGFRLPELIESAGARLREVGATNRTHVGDYKSAMGEQTGCLLKVHPSNFQITGFTSGVSVSELRSLADEHHVPLVVDLGSGLLSPDPVLPVEPDVASALTAGADVVIVSGDKLLGGPQSGILLGRAEIIARMARHPLARALRMDKLALAALEATVSGEVTPVTAALHADPGRLRERTEALAEAVACVVVEHDGRVGGGGAPGVLLPGWAVRLPESAARSLRTGSPAVLPRVHRGACLVDLRCIPEDDDERLAAAVRAALAQAGEALGTGGS